MLLTAYLLALIFIWTGMAATSVVAPCDHHMFDSGIQNCLSDFNKSMETTGYQHMCPWPTVKRLYNELNICVDSSATVSWCKRYTHLVDAVLLEVHEIYFNLCGQVHDPPLFILIMLIAPPIITTLFLPILCVGITTCETKMASTFGF
ncbi:receptor activity-modifying protein 1 [Pseudochaenichthys georgianus]|uniref:receptor activity-modifying protein 1 n=1 Tax=Pseudochaenichthys georgianus TaxID=52239 RepID=UPI0039C2A8F0